MSDDEDDRTICKYGADCYQQNTAHRKKYKHPKKRVRSPSERSPRKAKIRTPDKKHMKQPKKSPKKHKTEVDSHNDISDDSDELSTKRPLKKIKNIPQKHKTCHDDMSDYDSDEKSSTKIIKTTTQKHKTSPKERKITSQNPKTSHNDISDDDTVNSIEEIIEEPKFPKIDDVFDEELVKLTETIENKAEWLELKKNLIKKFFLVDMPQDFYQFWDFCKDINKKSPKHAFNSIGLTLIGPFDVLASNIVSENTKGEHLLHCRYYFDPPEFQTVLKGDNMEYHIGYFRDSPAEPPSFLAENNAAKDCIIKPIGANIFTAVNTYFDNFISRANPFKRMELLRFQKRLKDKAKEFNLDIRKNSNSPRHPVCKSFHTAGIVVPFDKKTDLGYRPLSVTDKELVKICDKVSKAPEESKSKAMSALQPVITAATIAIDECDFGTGLELGINLFCYGSELLDGTALRMLTSAYSVLDRHEFIEIAKAHLKNRKKGMPHVVNY